MNVQKGIWLNPGASTIGAGVDSFFEYALKAGIVLDDDQFADVWEDAYAAIMQVLRSPDGYMVSGRVRGLPQADRPHVLLSIEACTSA